MADTKGYGMVVYDSSRKHMCRVESDYMKPTNTTFLVDGDIFTYVGGIFSMTIMGDGKYSTFNIMSIISIVKLNLIIGY